MKTKSFTFLLLALLAAGILNSAFAQVITHLASGFIAPVGITSDLKGNLWINEAGTGNNDSKVSLVKVTNGKIFTTIRGLPSYLDTTTGEVSGTWRSYFFPDGSVLVVSGSGKDINSASLMYFDFKGWTPGVDSPKTVADARNVIHVGEFLIKNGFTDTDPFDVAWDSLGNRFISDAAANAVVKADAHDSLSILKAFPRIPNIYTTPPPDSIDVVPTTIKTNPAGGYYLSFLTGFPFLPGIASIINLDANGDTSMYASGLTQAVDMSVDSATGKVYVLQFGEYDASFNPIPGTAKIVRIDAEGNHTIASGFGPSAGMTSDGAGGFYVTSLLSGEILHITDIATGINEAPPLTSLNLSATPNPFSNETRIQFHLDHASGVKFNVLNIDGKEMFLQQKGNFTAGNQSFTWNGRNSSGKKLAAGIYFIRITTVDGTQAAKVIVN